MKARMLIAAAAILLCAGYAKADHVPYGSLGHPSQPILILWSPDP